MSDDIKPSVEAEKNLPENIVQLPATKVELPPRPEQAFEQEKASKTEKAEEGEAETEIAPMATGTVPMPVVTAPSERLRQVENILSDGLKEIYLSLPPLKQQEFKLAGEETARRINELLDQAVVKVNKIIELIKKWLSMIPGVNKFFLEQEVKIKTDEILKIKN